MIFDHHGHGTDKRVYLRSWVLAYYEPKVRHDGFEQKLKIIYPIPLPPPRASLRSGGVEVVERERKRSKSAAKEDGDKMHGGAPPFHQDRVSLEIRNSTCCPPSIVEDRSRLIDISTI